jgi:hypothetical protein
LGFGFEAVEFSGAGRSIWGEDTHSSVGIASTNWQGKTFFAFLTEEITHSHHDLIPRAYYPRLG